MRINIYAVVAAATVLSSLFLPWFSFVQTFFFGNSLVMVTREDLSPFQPRFSAIVMNASYNSIEHNYGTMYSSWKSQLNYLLQVGLTATQILPFILFLSPLLFAFAISLMAHIAFTTDSWSKAGRRVAIIASNLSFASIFLYVTAVVCYKDTVLTGFSGGHGGWLTLYAGIGAPGAYLGVGFWIAILSASLAYVSWLHPRFINIDARVNKRAVELLKRWLPSSEREKIAVIATSSFLAIFLLAILLP